MMNEWINRKAFRIINIKFTSDTQTVTVWLPVVHGNGFSLDVAAPSPLLWEEAETCSAHPAEQQSQAIAPLPLPGLPFTDRVSQVRPQSTVPCLAPAGWFSLQLSERLPLALTPLLLLDLFAAAAEIAAFPDLVTKRLEGNSSSSCGAGDPQSLRTVQLDINTENSALCRCSKLTGR